MTVQSSCTVARGGSHAWGIACGHKLLIACHKPRPAGETIGIGMTGTVATTGGEMTGDGTSGTGMTTDAAAATMRPLMTTTAGATDLPAVCSSTARPWPDGC